MITNRMRALLEAKGFHHGTEDEGKAVMLDGHKVFVHKEKAAYGPYSLAKKMTVYAVTTEDGEVLTDQHGTRREALAQAQRILALREIREAKGFHHGTVRQWKNGRHMKQGGGWERVRSGRSLPLASKMPAVSAASSGSIPAGPYGAGVFEDPSDFSRQAVPTRDMSAAIVNAVAGREVFAVGEALELYAQYLNGETLDEGALAKMKMVFGKLLKVGAKPAPKKPERPQGMSVLKRERQGMQDYLKRKKASIERGDR